MFSLCLFHGIMLISVARAHVPVAPAKVSPAPRNAGTTRNPGCTQNAKALPTSANNHQRANAEAAEKAGAAWHLPESALDDIAFDRFERMMRDRSTLARMSASGWELGNAVAAQVVLRKIEAVLQE